MISTLIPTTIFVFKFYSLLFIVNKSIGIILTLFITISLFYYLFTLRLVTMLIRILSISTPLLLCDTL